MYRAFDPGGMQHQQFKRQDSPLFPSHSSSSPNQSCKLANAPSIHLTNPLPSIALENKPRIENTINRRGSKSRKTRKYEAGGHKKKFQKEISSLPNKKIMQSTAGQEALVRMMLVDIAASQPPNEESRITLAGKYNRYIPKLKGLSLEKILEIFETCTF
jgi:hypothetical protein